MSLALKQDEPAVLALARSLGVPVRFFDADRLERETPRLPNPSDTVFDAVGSHGVAEAAALAAAGERGELIAPKGRGARVTCAVARAKSIDAKAVGRKQGAVAIVGLGPGAHGWRTPAVGAALARAEDLVGYTGYLDALGDLVCRGRAAWVSAGRRGRARDEGARSGECRPRGGIGVQR